MVVMVVMLVVVVVVVLIVVYVFANFVIIIFFNITIIIINVHPILSGKNGISLSLRCALFNERRSCSCLF